MILEALTGLAGWFSENLLHFLRLNRDKRVGTALFLERIADCCEKIATQAERGESPHAACGELHGYITIFDKPKPDLALDSAEVIQMWETLRSARAMRASIWHSMTRRDAAEDLEQRMGRSDPFPPAEIGKLLETAGQLRAAAAYLRRGGVH